MRKTKLTPLMNRVIWILEEAGEETLGTLEATLRAQGADGQELLGAALEGLQRLGFVSQTDSSVILTEHGRAALTR